MYYDQDSTVEEKEQSLVGGRLLEDQIIRNPSDADNNAQFNIFKNY
jgi:hypothetical protein